MIIRLLVAAIITLVGAMPGPTEFFKFETSSQAQPGSESSGTLETLYFEETGQYLSGDLLRFWSQFGGAQVFGFPVTPEVERNDRTVQYFDRAVLEIHPERSGEWRVMLRRLGAEAVGPSQRRSDVFVPENPTRAGIYFKETGFAISPLFVEHWQSYGGLRILGFPISRTFSANGTTLQYYERAVLEYHSDNPEDWRILMPSLGLDAALSDGVDTRAESYDAEAVIYHPSLLGRGGSGPVDRVVYLTFDDGPHAKWTPEVLDLLATFDAKGTFFVLGQYADLYPDLIERIAIEGHTLANHGYDHASMPGMPWSEFLRQIRETERAVGDPMAPCFRPPYGAMNDNTRRWAEALGYEVVLWDIDPQDWQRPGSDAIADRIVSHITPGDVILLHDGGGDRAQTIEALEIVLEDLTKRGYRFDRMCK